MPQKQEKPEKNKLIDESMQRALAKVQGEMPDVNRTNLTSSADSPLARFLMPKNAQAVTNPFTGNMNYNPEAMAGQSSDEMEGTMAHELTHVRQAQNTPWYQTAMNIFKPDPQVPQGISPNSVLNNPYYWRPHEMEAFQAERNRAAAQGTPYYRDPVLGTSDINLPSDKKKKGIDTAPSPEMTKRWEYMKQHPLYPENEKSSGMISTKGRR